MRCTLADARRWVSHGTAMFDEAVADLSEQDYAAPSALPAWSRKHLVAHVAANADALRNLVHWAATGERTPMYATLEQRDADIQAGAELSGGELGAWLASAGRALDVAMDQLSEEQWQTPVVTAQGRTVPATEIAWLRARELWVHVVDLDLGVGFQHLPPEFLVALCDEVAEKRCSTPAVAVTLDADGHRWELPGNQVPAEVTGTLPDVAAYLTGRPNRLTTVDGAPAPELPAWL